MSYFDALVRFLGAVEEEVIVDRDLDLPPTAGRATYHARLENQDPFSDLQEHMQQKDEAHRLRVFAEEMSAFYKDKARRNELDAMEARFAAMDAVEGTNWRMKKINQWKREAAEAEMGAWDQQVDTLYRRR